VTDIDFAGKWSAAALGFSSDLRRPQRSSSASDHEIVRRLGNRLCPPEAKLRIPHRISKINQLGTRSLQKATLPNDSLTRVGQRCLVRKCVLLLDSGKNNKTGRDAASNRLRLARSSHFLRSAARIIVTNVERPEPLRPSIG